MGFISTIFGKNKEHIEIIVADASQTTIKFISFFASNHLRQLFADPTTAPKRIVGTIDVSHFGGKTEVRMRYTHSVTT